MQKKSTPPPAAPDLEGLVGTRAGLEKSVAGELKSLGIPVTRIGRRAVFFRTDLAGVYRANMGLRSGLNVLLPIRTFNARNYDMLYYQSRKTNWHKLFPVERTLRIDVNGGSDELRNSEYVVHRVKDGIVDTFRKLAGGIRPSIDKRDPDIHIVVHLDAHRVTLCLDTSGQPLFKRGYREAHGIAPLKEDLAAAILRIAGWDGTTSLIDPLCGSGTFLFEAWMKAANKAPNLDRRFAFESLFDYDAHLHAAEREALEAAERSPRPEFKIIGLEKDAATRTVAETIRKTYFLDAPITIEATDFRAWPDTVERFFAVTNPPYGKRIGTHAEAVALHRELADFLRKRCPNGRAAVFSANPDGIAALGPTEKSWTLYNGALEGQLVRFPTSTVISQI